MLRTFEAIKRSPFSGGNSFARPTSEKASAEIVAFARLKFWLRSLAGIARLHKTPVTGASAEIVASACLSTDYVPK